MTSVDAIIANMDATGDPQARRDAIEGHVFNVEPWSEAEEAECVRIDLARHDLKTRDGGWAYEQHRADHALRRDGR